MKKTLLVLFMMVALMGSVFAMDATVEGDAVATFGVNLENGDSGFENSLSDFGIYFNFIDEGSAFDNNGDGMYGSIEISDVSMKLFSDGTAATYDNDDDSLTGTVSAKIHSGNMFVGVYNKPDVDTNYAENFGYSSAMGAFLAADAADTAAAAALAAAILVGDPGDIAAATTAAAAASAAASAAFVALDAVGVANTSDFNNDILNLKASGGMSFGYDDGTNSVELSVSSVGDWDADQKVPAIAVAADWMNGKTSAVAAGTAGTLNTDNKYVVGLKADLDFGAPALEASFLYGNKQWGDDPYIGFGVAPAYELAMSDSMGVEASVGVDVVVMPDGYGTTDDTGLYYDVAPEVTLNLAPENEDGDRSNLMVGAYMASSNAKFMTDNFNMLLNLQAVFTEEHDGGFVDGLGSEVSFALLNILDQDKDDMINDKAMSWKVDADLDYDVLPGLTPSVGFGYGTDNYKANLALGLEMGADFTGIANTTFNIDYASASIMENTTEGVAAVGGVMTVATKISW